MRNYTLFILSTFIIITSCTSISDHETVISKANDKLQEFEGFEYTALAMYPNPMGIYDTTSISISFNKNDSSLIGYDYIAKNRGKYQNSDIVNLNGDYRFVQHSDKLVQFYPSSDYEQEEYSIKNDLAINYSPLRYLELEDWQLVSDTLLDNQSYANYMRIEGDRVNDNGDKILTEQHIFINSSNYLIERFERRNHFNGALSQVVIYEYQDYAFYRNDEELTYTFPEGYNTALLGVSPYANNLKVGQTAPEFTTVDEQNNVFNLSDYRGQKVLLDFSIINCGYCLQSLKHFNQEGYQLSEDIFALYINPLDSKQDMSAFNDQYYVPFPIVVDNTGEIAQQYGVLSYPLFYLINEDGVIEQVINGFDEEFQESLGS